MMLIYRIPKRLYFLKTSKKVLPSISLFTFEFKNKQRAQYHCFSKTFPNSPNKLYSLRNVKDFCYAASILENSVVENSNYEKSEFLKMLDFRKKQAESSVLLELHNKDDIAYALSACEKFGAVKQAFSFLGESENVFILLEYEEKASIQKFLRNAHFKNIIDAFPVLSRFVGYVKKSNQEKPTTSIKVLEDLSNAFLSKDGTVSDLIENIYLTEKLSELDIRKRFFFCCILKEVMCGLFPYCDAIPFGSSVNGIGRQGCDLDLMMRLYPEKIDSSSEFYFVNKTCVGDLQNLQRKVVQSIGHLLRTFSPGITSVQTILHARVPIAKLDHKILGMKIDISVNNMAPILMSELLHFCGEIDNRIRPLIYAVKKWAKETNITYEPPGSYISNFSLTLLVIFFLQSRPIPVLPPMNEVIFIRGAECSEEYRIEYLMTPSELQAKASANKESSAFLLKEFLAYVGSNPFTNKHISLLTGKASEKESDYALWIQYPFEEDLNVSKNVSYFELDEMCNKARVSAKYLESNLNSRGAGFRDLSTLLGVQNIRKQDVGKSKRIDVNMLLEDAKNQNKKIGRQRSFK